MASRLAVVILNYNGRNFLEKFLPNVIKNSVGYEVIVADNASTDDSVNWMIKQHPDTSLIQINENLGYAGGYNHALASLKNSGYQYFVLLNSDVETTPNWINPIVELMDLNPNIAACQPKIKSYHQKEFFEYAGAAGGFIDYLGYPFCRGRIFSTLEKDSGQYNVSGPIFWATGACMFVRSEVYFDMQGLDDRFFAHMEEIDFCWRAKKLGHQIYYCADSSVYHVGGGTLQAESPFKTYLNFRNNWLLLFKNLSSKEFDQIKKKRKYLDLLAAFQFIAKGKFTNAKAIFRAHRAFKKMKSSYRPSVENGFHYSEVLKASLIKQYFMKGKKKFSKLRFNSTSKD